MAPRFSPTAWIDAEGAYLRGLLTGDPGELQALGPPGYRQNQPVTAVLMTQFPRSLVVMIGALLLSLVVGGAFGLLASRFGLRWLRGITMTGTLLILSAPDVLMVFFLRKLMILGEEGYGMSGLLLSPNSEGAEAIHILAPALVLGCLPVALTARLTTAAFDEVFDQLYIRTALAKGLSRGQVILGHALRNAFIRVLDSGAYIAGTLTTGLVVVELLFFYPGLGRTLGLILERGGQPGASSSITLIFLATAMALEGLFSAVRYSLDPRQQVTESGGVAAIREKAFLLRAMATRVWVTLKDWGRATVYAFVTRHLWVWRPSRLLRGVFDNVPLVVGLAAIGGLLFLAFFGERLADLRAAETIPKHVIHGGTAYFPPFRPGFPNYPLGSDLLGRDLLSRVLIGARYTVFLALAVTPIRFVLALPWGLMAAYRGGRLAWWSRTLGITLAGVPIMMIPAAILPLRYLASVEKGPYFLMISVMLAVVGIPRLAETVRLQADTVLKQPFLEGAQSVGATDRRILWNHVLPHLTPHLWVAAAADMAWTLLLMAQLGVFGIYLGGVAPWQGRQVLPRIPDWSSMLAKPYELIYRAPWALWVPAAAFLAAILAFNLTAEGLRRRAHNLTGESQVMEVELLPGGRVFVATRHWLKLLTEWAVVAVCVGAVVVTGSRLQSITGASAASENVVTALERSRREMQIALDTIYGTASVAEAAKSAAKLSTVMAEYMLEANGARLFSSDMQGDTRGHANFFDLGSDVRIMSIVIPKERTGTGEILGFLFVQDRTEGGRVRVFPGGIKPAYAAKLGPERMVLTGTVPGPDNWQISVWQRTAAGWGPDPEMTGALHTQIPAGMGARLRSGQEAHVIDLTGGPLNSARVSGSGDVEVCPGPGAPCTWIPFENGTFGRAGG